MPASWCPRLTFEIASTIAVLLVLFGIHYSAILADDVRIIVFKEPIVNKFLADHVISKEVVTSEGGCRVKCYMEPKCVSVNLGPLAEGKQSCELNYATAEHQSASQLMTEVGYTYLAIENPCISNPCHSGNKCQAGFTSKGFRCLPAKSCSEIKKLNASVESGIYVIDPDGEESLPPFNVTCNMTDHKGIGVTVISHDSESRTLVDGFENSGTYSRDVHYTGATLRQLGSLAEVSSHCEQSIRYECYSSKLNKKDKPDKPVGWWLSRDSAKMTYWDGASGIAKCACANRNNCTRNAGCNCDVNDFTWREDSGLLTNKNDLPVTQLRFGDTGVDKKDGVARDDRDEKGYHTLGKFRCFGIA